MSNEVENGEVCIKESDFLRELILQLRALDQFGTWSSVDDRELLIKKYIKTKEQLKSMPVIADIDEVIISEIKLIFKALAIAFERKSKEMANIVMEMSHEGFGRVVVFCDEVVLLDKTFRDAHRFGYKSLEHLRDEGEKMLERALERFKKFKGVK